MDLVELGSQTAKNGFKNEDDIINKFNNWITDVDSQKWLIIMGYKLNEIKSVSAVKVQRHKTDVQVQIIVIIEMEQYTDVQNLQVKLVSNVKGFNQIDKRWVDNYIELWSIPNDVIILLKHFTGELPPYIDNPSDPRRMFLNEFIETDRQKLLYFFSANKVMIITDILKGRGRMAAEWMLVAQKIQADARWILKPMNVVMNYYSSGAVKMSPQGSILLGRITVQRKGGDGGRNTANMLQFKINPAELFKIVE